MDTSPAPAPAITTLAPVRPVAAPLELRAFTGLLLSPSRAGDPASARAFSRPYRDVPARIRRWQHQGHLRRDSGPALYVHEYTASGMTVRGIVGALAVSRRTDDPANQAVWPHEAIHEAQARELAERMRQMELNPAPILLVHRGPAELRLLLDRVTSGEPEFVFTDKAGQRNRIWSIRDEGQTAEINSLLSGSQALIADGHHRYAAYLRLQELGQADSGLAMLVDQGDTPLFLGAIHRVLVGVRLRHLRSALPDPAGYRETSRADALAALDSHTIVATNGRNWATLRLPGSDGPGEVSDVIAVEAFHRDVVDRLRPQPQRINYHHTVEDALARLPTSAVAVLLPAPEFEQVRTLIASGGLLPEKATSFQPKPALGVIMRSLADG